MTTLSVSGANDLRCSVQTATLGEHPAGSAGFARRVLLVELPLPWPKKIDQHDLLDGLDIDDKTIKVLGIVATGNADPDLPSNDQHRVDQHRVDQHRVICWERTEPFRGFERTEAIVDRSMLASSLQAIAESGPAAIGDHVDVDPRIEDLLICTHGTRDRCCGQLGTRLHTELDGAFSPLVRMWRTSHTGGHRFAPTGIHFPHGTTWSTLTKELAVSIVEQSADTTDLDAHYRGNLGIQGRPAQIAEGATFLDQGWAWLGGERTVVIAEADGDHVVATVRSNDHEATVTMTEHAAIPVPACGEDLDASTKATPQFHIIRGQVSATTRR